MALCKGIGRITLVGTSSLKIFFRVLIWVYYSLLYPGQQKSCNFVIFFYYTFRICPINLENTPWLRVLRYRGNCSRLFGGGPKAR
jgi:hypothetical protein